MASGALTTAEEHCLSGSARKHGMTRKAVAHRLWRWPPWVHVSAVADASTEVAATTFLQYSWQLAIASHGPMMPSKLWAVLVER